MAFVGVTSTDRTRSDPVSGRGSVPRVSVVGGSGGAWRIAASLARSTVRGRFGSFAGLTVMVAVVTAVVLAGAAGAHRTSTVLDRHLAEINARDMTALVLDPALNRDLAATEALRDSLADVDGVTGVSRTVGYFVMAEADPSADLILAGSPDSTFTAVDRARPRRGRLPSATSVDEVALNGPAAEALGLDVGDRLVLATFKPETIEQLFLGAGFPENGPDGPVVDLEVVGLVQTGDELSATQEEAGPVGIVSAGFVAEHEGEIGRSVLQISIQADDGTDLDAVQAAVDAGVDPRFERIVTPIEREYVGEARRAYRTLAVGLVVFSAVALLAGLYAIAQAVLRLVPFAAPADAVAWGMGAARRVRRLAVALPLAAAVASGVAVGVVVSVVASPLFPLSVARRAEIDPGVRVDAPVLLAGAMVVSGAVLGLVAVAAGRAVSRVRVPGRAEGVRTGRRTGRSGWNAPLPVAIGLRALGGAARATTRSAVGGAVVAVAGVVAVLIFTASVDAASSDPRRYGWAWTTSPDVESQDPAQAADAVAEDPAVAASGVLIGGPLAVGGRTV